LNGHLRCEFDPAFADAELDLPTAEVGVPRPEAFLDGRHLLLTTSHLRLAFDQLLFSLLREHRRVFRGLIAERADQFPIDQHRDSTAIETPADSQHRLQTAHFAAVTGTRTIRYVSPCPTPANSVRSILARTPRSRSITGPPVYV
jgi:hypothetical protein